MNVFYPISIHVILEINTVTIYTKYEGTKAFLSKIGRRASATSPTLPPATEGISTEGTGTGIGTGGSHFWPALNQASGKISLLGLPLLFTEHCKAKGDQGDCLLINPQKYAIGLRADLRIESSAHVYFSTDHKAFRAILRVDAMPINNKVLTLSDGVTEVADFVTLDERA